MSQAESLCAGLPPSDGDVTAGLEAISSGVALHDLSAWQWLQVTGPDHVDFIHRMCTNSVTNRAVGDCLEIVFTENRGRIVERVDLYRIDDDRSWLVLGPGEPHTLTTWLDRYIFSEAIQFHPPTRTQRMFEVLGPEAEACIREILPQVAGASTACGLAAPNLLYARHKWTDVELYRFTGSEPDITQLWQRLASAGAVSCPEASWQLHRINAGIAVRGAELSDAHNPWEAGLGHAVDLNKGCFIGQEVIARLEAYDKVKQQLVGLDLPANAAPGMRLMDTGRDVGYVSSRAAQPAGRIIGLGYVRNAQAQVHHRLELEGGGEATIRLVVPRSRP